MGIKCRKRVQSVAVKIICDREKEIRQFVPKEYWTINAVLSDISNEFSFKAKLHAKGKKKLIFQTRKKLRKFSQN